MKKRLNFKNGVSLISILIISAIAIILTVTVVKLVTKGANVLSKAQSAKEESRESTIKDAMAILIASYKTESIPGSVSKTFKTFLEEKKLSTEIENFWYTDKVIIIKYQSAYVILKEIGKDFAILGSLPFYDDESVERTMEYYTQSLEFKGEESVKFEDKNVYIISEDVKPNCYDYTIPENSEIVLAFIDDLEINNKELEKSAIELEKESTLNLYVFSNVIINSRYNGNSKITYNEIDSNFGYAGIHVPVESYLGIYGTGNLTCYGGMAKKGGTYEEEEYTSGTGGGGAGAGIGGNGGYGGSQSKHSSLQGGLAGSCGTIGIGSNVTVMAYGGAGAEGGDSTNTGAGAGGGYPAAGIGGGGAGGAGATEFVGAGGFSGGAGASIDENKIAGGKDGLSGGHIEDLSLPEYYFAGGGYLEGAIGKDSKKVNRAEKCLGGFGGIGHEVSENSGNGGIGGSGGTVIITGNAEVNAFNGNKTTDGKEAPGTNPVEIYAQSGYSIEKYNYKSAENMKFTLNRFLKKKKVKTIDYGQGIGAGAGYTEGNNGKFKDSTKN